MQSVKNTRYTPPKKKCADFEPQIKYVMSLINNLSHVIKEGRLDTKRELIGVMFPEKFDFDGKSYRTNSYNKVLDIIYQQTNELRGQKKKTLQIFLKSLFKYPLRGCPMAKIVRVQHVFQRCGINVGSTLLSQWADGFIYFPILVVFC